MTGDITLNRDFVIEGNIGAGTKTAKQMTNELESLLSEVLPDIEQLLQQYEVLETLEIHLVHLAEAEQTLAQTSLACYLRNGFMKCPCLNAKEGEVPQYDELLGLSPEKAEQFSADVASKLSTIFPRLSQLAQQTDEIFEVHLFINPATVNSEQLMVCQWISDPEQGNIFQCSKP